MKNVRELALIALSSELPHLKPGRQISSSRLQRRLCATGRRLASSALCFADSEHPATQSTHVPCE